jgi:5-methylcytosine-specific restriction enzyme A
VDCVSAAANHSLIGMKQHQQPPARERPWRQWYQLERWRRLRRYQLRREPLCAMCLDRGRVTLATIADHVEPHRGNWNKFLTGKLQSLCKPCHDRDKSFVDKHGHAPIAIGLNGWPIDPPKQSGGGAGSKLEESPWPRRARAHKNANLLTC